jgi:hypothetical protein
MMTTGTRIGLAVVALVALTVAPAAAQPPGQDQGSTGAQSPAMPQPHMHGQHMQHHQAMHGMCDMMGGGMMGGGMMGGMPMMGMTGEASARMLQMRGEMLRAMGDVLIKYGKAMEGTSK